MCMLQGNNTPLHYASHDGRSEAVEALVANGATVEIMNKVSLNIIMIRYCSIQIYCTYQSLK